MTTTSRDTVKTVLDTANPNQLADALQKVKLGTLLTPTKLTLTSLTSTDTHVITDVEHGSNPAILAVVALRVTAGAAAAGVRVIGDAGATASATVAKLSDNGTTLVFETTVTGFVLEYIPRPSVDMSSAFARA